MTRGDLRRRCAAKLQEFGLRPSAPVTELQARLEQRRGRSIRFVPVRTDGRSRCGLWVSTGDTDLVLYEWATSPLHRRHIMLHELAHMLWGHEGVSPYAPALLRVVVPDLDPTRVRQVLGRGLYVTEAEQEAEMTATLLGEVARSTDDFDPLHPARPACHPLGGARRLDGGWTSGE